MSFANAGNFKYTLCKRRTEMRQNSNRRAYLLIAAIAIGIALLLLLLPHANAGHAPVYLILLPIVFIGLLPFTQWLSRAQFMRCALRREEPELHAFFQRPPPLLLS
jgi:hypothetical protein